jgi:hypothetical protein
MFDWAYHNGIADGIRHETKRIRWGRFQKRDLGEKPICGMREYRRVSINDLEHEPQLRRKDGFHMYEEES